ncbi:MAG: DNA primase [Desulfobacteraceae bacterium]|nr:DNA primase [Desulfobacteraceae bacterium]
MAKTIPEDTIRRIQEAANIVDLIGDSVVLKKTGRDYVGLCPFHAEKTPSFSVSPEKQIFYCFGCHTGGNVFSFLMKQEGLSFPEAVRNIANKYGIEVPQERLTASHKKALSERDKLYRTNEAALGFFRKQLFDPQVGRRAMEYLNNRGMNKDIIDAHMLGYAPGVWDGLLRYFRDKPCADKFLAKAGLVIPRKERNGYYDRFRDRIIFPIFNTSRKIIGYAGRVLDEGMPKYLNSPETAVFNKRRSLYGVDKVRRKARLTEKIFVVEGYFDVLAMHLYGIENTVASMGTALTKEHAQSLKGLIGQNGQVILVFDSDQAGIKAAMRSISVFEQGFVDARILVLPEGYDPDLYLREYGADSFKEVSERARGMIPFLMDAAIAEHGLSVEGKIKIISALQGSLAAVEDKVSRTLHIQEIAERLGVDQSAVMEKVRQACTQTGNQASSKIIRRHDPPMIIDYNRLEHQIVAMMLKYPVMISVICERNILDLFEDQKLKAVAGIILERFSKENDKVADLISMTNDSDHRSLMTRLSMTQEHWDRDGCERILSQIEQRQLRKIGSDLQRKIEAAEKDNNIELLGELLRLKQKQAGKGLIYS